MYDSKFCLLVKGSSEVVYYIFVIVGKKKELIVRMGFKMCIIYGCKI